MFTKTMYDKIKFGINKFNGKLVGSRFLEINRPDSDWDFLFRYSKEAFEYFDDLKFDVLGNYTLVINNNTKPNHNLMLVTMEYESEEFGTVHIIFSEHPDTLYRIYCNVKNAKLFTKETDKRMRIHVFELLCREAYAEMK